MAAYFRLCFKAKQTKAVNGIATVFIDKM